MVTECKLEKIIGILKHAGKVRKAFCYQKLFWPFTVWINCSSDLKNFANSRPSASNFKSFSQSLEYFFLTVGQNNFWNKIPWICFPGDMALLAFGMIAMGVVMSGLLYFFVLRSGARANLPTMRGFDNPLTGLFNISR